MVDVTLVTASDLPYAPRRNALDRGSLLASLVGKVGQMKCGVWADAEPPLC